MYIQEHLKRHLDTEAGDFHGQYVVSCLEWVQLQANSLGNQFVHRVLFLAAGMRCRLHRARLWVLTSVDGSSSRVYNLSRTLMKLTGLDDDTFLADSYGILGALWIIDEVFNLTSPLEDHVRAGSRDQQLAGFTLQEC